MSDALKSPENAPDDELAKWVNEVLPKAFVYARSLVRDVHAAEDIVHDCVCRLLARKARYDLAKDGFRLLLRAISNASIDRIRKQSPRLFDDLDAGGEEQSSALEIDLRTIDPSDLVLSKELEMAIEKGLQALPINQRAALELKGLGLRLAEIAESLQITESYAGVLLHRARSSMAIHLAAWLKADEA